MTTKKKKPLVKRSKIDATAIKLAKAKLLLSGLSLEDADQLSIDILSGSQVSRLDNNYQSLCALKLNYLGPDGQPLSDWPKGKSFYRLRYLETPPADFSSIAGKKPLRYIQPLNTAPVVYYPQNFEGWLDLCLDVDQPLIITEGELKAASACQAGFPTLGLGGVYNWRSNKLGITWLDSLDFITWPRRCVYICFDSDYRTNPMVCGALRLFAEELQRQGAFSYLVSLPQLAGLDKVGLDDYLVHTGVSAPDQLERLLHEAEALGLAAPLWGLNDKYVYVQNPGCVIDQTTNYKASPSGFKEHLEAPAQYQERSVRADGTVSYKAISAATTWLKWPLRTEAKKLTYAPGEEKFTKRNSGLWYNTWQGWGVEPKKGDVKPFIQLIDHIFTHAEPGAKEWFYHWCAYPLQYPGTKMFSSVLIHGIRHGTGKSLIGYSLGKIYGDNFTEISQRELHESHNEWADGKQFIMGDDITGSNKRADNDYLKKLITQQSIRLNPKFISSYTIPDCINWFFSANHPDAFFLEDDDRRNFIHEVTVGPLDELFYVEYMLWLDTGGAAAIFDWLLKRPLKGFNPAAPAFRTAAKERMISNVQSDLAGWVRQLLLTPDHVLRMGEIVANQDLFTNQELLQFYDPHGKTGTTANGLGRELSRAGIRQVCAGRPVRLLDGSQQRYYAIRNVDMWLAAAPKKVARYLDGLAAPVVKGKKY